MDKDYIDFDVEVLHETDQAVWVSDGINEVWIPKSQISDELEYLTNGLVRILIPEWLAKEKGLI